MNYFYVHFLILSKSLSFEKQKQRFLMRIFMRLGNLSFFYSLLIGTIRWTLWLVASLASKNISLSCLSQGAVDVKSHCKFFGFTCRVVSNMISTYLAGYEYYVMNFGIHASNFNRLYRGNGIPCLVGGTLAQRRWTCVPTEPLWYTSLGRMYMSMSNH